MTDSSATERPSHGPENTTGDGGTREERLLLYAADLWGIKANILAVRVIMEQFRKKGTGGIN